MDTNEVLEELLSRRADVGNKPPEQNRNSLIPYTRLVHNLDDLDNLSDAVAIDLETVSLIQRKTAVFSDEVAERQCVEMTLTGYDTQFKVDIWLIPIFSDGIVVHLLFAADNKNRELLYQHRNPVKAANYDILSL